jgi:MFS family permease
MLDTIKNKKDRSLSFFHAEAISSSVENAGIAYQSPSLLSTGGAAKDVALLSTAANLIFALLLIKLPALIKSEDSIKHGTVILACVAALAWLPLIIIPVLFAGLSPALLVCLWVVSLIPSMLVGPLRDKWVADLVPAGRMGRYLSLRQIISAGTYLSTFYMMGYWLDISHSGTSSGFTFIFLIAFIGSLVSLLLYFGIRVAVKLGQVDETKFGLLDFLYEAKQNKIGMFMAYVTLVTFSASISSAFFSVYMLKTLQFTYLTYTLVISVEFLARMISLSIWGKLVDSVGAIKVIRVVSFLIPLIPVLWLFSSNVGYLMMVQFFSGVWWAAFDLCNQTHICSASPPSKRLHYIVYQRCIITFASAAGPLLGAYLINFVFPVFGNPVFGIFLLSGLCRFLVVVTLSHRLKENQPSGQGDGQQLEEVDVFPGRVVSGKAYYQYPKFERAAKKAAVDDPAPDIKTGLFYRPEHWVRGPVAMATAGPGRSTRNHRSGLPDLALTNQRDCLARQPGTYPYRKRQPFDCCPAKTSYCMAAKCPFTYNCDRTYAKVHQTYSTGTFVAPPAGTLQSRHQCAVTLRR